MLVSADISFRSQVPDTDLKFFSGSVLKFDLEAKTVVQFCSFVWV